MKNPIKLVQIVLAVPADSDAYMDALSDLRDNSDGEIIEWATAINADGERIAPEVVEGDSLPMAELFESDRVSPSFCD